MEVTEGIRSEEEAPGVDCSNAPYDLLRAEDRSEADECPCSTLDFATPEVSTSDDVVNKECYRDAAANEVLEN